MPSCRYGLSAIILALIQICEGEATHDGSGKPIKINKKTGLPQKPPRGFLKRITELLSKSKQKTETEHSDSKMLDFLDNREVRRNLYGVPIK